MAAEAREIPQAEQEADRQGAPGYATALLAVVVMLGVTAVLALLIYLLMIAISPIESREPTSRANARPAVQGPYTPPPPPAPSK